MKSKLRNGENQVIIYRRKFEKIVENIQKFFKKNREIKKGIPKILRKQSG